MGLHNRAKRFRLTSSLFFSQSDGEEIARDELPEFRVFVSQRAMKLPRTNSEAPVYGPAKIVWEATHNRPGGLSAGHLP